MFKFGGGFSQSQFPRMPQMGQGLQPPQMQPLGQGQQPTGQFPLNSQAGQMPMMDHQRPQQDMGQGGFMNRPGFQQIMGQNGGMEAFQNAINGYQSQVSDWRGQRPQFTQDGAPSAYNQQMDDWRGQRPDRSSQMGSVGGSGSTARAGTGKGRFPLGSR
jgi:hypothetical protein